MDDFKTMFDNSDCQQFLSVVTTMHHQGVGKTFNNGALCFSESLDVVTTSSVGKEGLESGLLFDGEIIS